MCVCLCMHAFVCLISRAPGSPRCVHACVCVTKSVCVSACVRTYMCVLCGRNVLTIMLINIFVLRFYVSFFSKLVGSGQMLSRPAAYVEHVCSMRPAVCCPMLQGHSPVSLSTLMPNSVCRWWFRRLWPVEVLSWWSLYVPCTYRMPGGVIVGDSGLCCYGPAFNV